MPEEKGWDAKKIFEHLVKNDPIMEEIVEKASEGLPPQVLSSPEFILSIGFSAMAAANAAMQALLIKNLISEEELDEIVNAVKNKISEAFGIDLGYHRF